MNQLRVTEEATKKLQEQVEAFLKKDEKYEEQLRASEETNKKLKSEFQEILIENDKVFIYVTDLLSFLLL